MKITLPLALLAISPAIYAESQDPQPLQIKGSVEGALTYGGPGTETLGLRQFDQRNRQLRLVNGRIVLIYKHPKTPFGFTFEPWVGDAADILYRTDPTESSLTKYMGQALVSYFGPNGTVVEIGKFNSWIGYESPLSADGEFVSRGLLYTLVQPAYHLGARASFAICPDLTGSIYLTNGWNQIERQTGGTTIGGQIKWQATPATSVAFNYIGGKEGGHTPNRAGSFGGAGFSNAGATETHLYDLVATHDPDTTTHFALNADYAKSQQPNPGNWYGISLVGKKTFGQNESLALRLEWVGDPDGLRTGRSATLYGTTLTYERPVNQQLTLRLEGRYDQADTDMFFRNSVFRKSQFSVAAGFTYRF